jgi:hypothetical protein
MLKPENLLLLIPFELLGIPFGTSFHVNWLLNSRNLQTFTFYSLLPYNWFHHGLQQVDTQHFFLSPFSPPLQWPMRDMTTGEEVLQTNKKMRRLSKYFEYIIRIQMRKQWKHPKVQENGHGTTEFGIVRQRPTMPSML